MIINSKKVNWRKRKPFALHSILDTHPKKNALETGLFEIPAYKNESITPYFLTLPDELIVLIFKTLDLKSTVFSSRVCTRFYVIFHDSLLWKKIYLSATNLDRTFIHLFSKSFPFTHHFDRIIFLSLVGTESPMNKSLYSQTPKIFFSHFMYLLTFIPKLKTLSLTNFSLEYSNFSSTFVHLSLNYISFFGVYFNLNFFGDSNIEKYFPSLLKFEIVNCPGFQPDISLKYFVKIRTLTELYVVDCYRAILPNFLQILILLDEFKSRCKCYLDGVLINA